MIHLKYCGCLCANSVSIGPQPQLGTDSNVSATYQQTRDELMLHVYSPEKCFFGKCKTYNLLCTSIIHNVYELCIIDSNYIY